MAITFHQCPFISWPIRARSLFPDSSPGCYPHTSLLPCPAVRCQALLLPLRANLHTEQSQMFETERPAGPQSPGGRHHPLPRQPPRFSNVEGIARFLESTAHRARNHFSPAGTLFQLNLPPPIKWQWRRARQTKRVAFPPFMPAKEGTPDVSLSESLFPICGWYRIPS